ncbi:30S ribosomal protein S20 [PVC group bacterium]|nr:30S ribosomal protein S20 [PVC group bacterium]
MPNIKSAMKRVRTTEKRTVINKTSRSRISSARRKFRDTVATGDKPQSEETYKVFCSALDKGVKSGIIKANTAARNKSRGAKALAGME